MTHTQPTALQIADHLLNGEPYTIAPAAAAELRRLHAIEAALAQPAPKVVDCHATGVCVQSGLRAEKPAPVQPVAMTLEQDFAICEANCIGESDAYFKARPAMDTRENRRIFESGHRRGWLSSPPAHALLCSEQTWR
jgi:hypothetical protein